MQEKDVVSIDYFENPARFADLLNGYIYHGQEWIRPEDVREISRSVSRIDRSKKRTRGRNGTKLQTVADIIVNGPGLQNVIENRRI